VTRPGGWQPGRPAHNPRVESWPPLDRAGVTAGARSMPSTRTRHEPAWAWLPVRSGPLDAPVIRVLPPGWSVAELLMPTGWAALAGEVEQVPQRLDGADVAGFLPGIDGCVEQFRAPEVADRLPVAVKYVQLRPLHLPRRRLAPLLPRLGRRRRHLRRHPAHRSGPRPSRQGPARPRRGTVHPQRGVPPPLECPQRPLPRGRHEALPPPGSRAAGACLRSVDMISEPGLTLTSYAAEPASPTAHALAILASWAATQNLETPARNAERTI
jgi:hypothetical protein